MAINTKTYESFCGVCIHNIGIQEGKVYCNYSKKPVDVIFDVCAALTMPIKTNGDFDKEIKQFRKL